VAFLKLSVAAAAAAAAIAAALLIVQHVTGGDERPAEGAFNLRIDQSGGSCARLGTPEADGATLDAQS
jgi:putative component of toxin-antitoxin plasmid stabilization module